MPLIKDFREFALKGNVVDLAVGVIIGGAFGKIVSSIVNDIIMPPIGIILGRVDFKDLRLVLQQSSDIEIMKGGNIIKQHLPEVSIKYGSFIQNIFEFFIIAFCVFLIIKTMNHLNRKKEDNPNPIVELNTQEKLLIEIRDLLKK